MSTFATFRDAVSAAYAGGLSPVKESGVTSFRSDCPKCRGRQTLRLQPTPEGPSVLNLWCDVCNRLPVSLLVPSDVVAEEVFGDHPTAIQKASRLVIQWASDVIICAVEWLWPGFLPFGKLVQVVGLPGVGKTTVAMDILARATRGNRMPGADFATGPVTVLIAGAEDGIEDTLTPRLVAANADLARVGFVTLEAREQFTIPGDVEALERAIKATGARVVYVDSIMGSLDEDVKSYSDQSVRKALRPLADVAARTGALILFISHPRKAGANNAIDAGGGSGGFVALARVQLTLGYDPADLTKESRVLAVGKSNIGRIPESRAYQVVSGGNGHGSIAWGGASAVTADELASAPMRQRQFGGGSAGEPETKQSFAAEWLTDMLADGAQRTPAFLTAEARAIKLSWRTVERAAKDIGVLKVRGKVGEPSTWYLSERPAVAPTVAPTRRANPSRQRTRWRDGDIPEDSRFSRPAIRRAKWREWRDGRK